MSTSLKPHEKWKAHRPHKGDAITTLVNGGELLGIVGHVDGNICWLEDGDCFIWCFREGLNKLHTWDRKRLRHSPADSSLSAVLREGD